MNPETIKTHEGITFELACELGITQKPEWHLLHLICQSWDDDSLKSRKLALASGSAMVK